MTRELVLPILVVLVASTAVGCHEGESSSPCTGVSCSDRGSCVEVEARAQCSCDPGFEPNGLECLAAGADGDADADGDREADSEAEPGLSCMEALGCILGCADAPCAMTCTGAVCDGSVEAFADLLGCAEEHCEVECDAWISAACRGCISDDCSVEGLMCQHSGC